MESSLTTNCSASMQSITPSNQRSSCLCNPTLMRIMIYLSISIFLKPHSFPRIDFRPTTPVTTQKKRLKLGSKIKHSFKTTSLSRKISSPSPRAFPTTKAQPRPILPEMSPAATRFHKNQQYIEALRNCCYHDSHNTKYKHWSWSRKNY